MSLSKFRGKRAAAYDDLARAIHGAIVTLEATGAIGPADADPDYAPFNGYSARACAAYVYLSSHEPRAVPLCENPGMRLKKLKEPGSKFGESHYWLEDDDGRVLDLVFTDRKRLPGDIKYAKGKGGSVRRDRHDSNLPARKDTQRIIALVRAALDGD